MKFFHDGWNLTERNKPCMSSLEKALGRTGWGIFRGMMTLWSLSHFCTEKIKILIVQYAVITEQTSSPRAFLHFSRF